MAYPDAFAYDRVFDLAVMATEATLVFHLTGYWILVGAKQPRCEVFAYSKF